MVKHMHMRLAVCEFCGIETFVPCRTTRAVKRCGQQDIEIKKSDGQYYLLKALAERLDTSPMLRHALNDAADTIQILHRQLSRIGRQPTEAMCHAARDWSIAKYGKTIGSKVIGQETAIGCWQVMWDQGMWDQASKVIILDKKLNTNTRTNTHTHTDTNTDEGR